MRGYVRSSVLCGVVRGPCRRAGGGGDAPGGEKKDSLQKKIAKSLHMN